jgi:hypothetical protein
MPDLHFDLSEVPMCLEAGEHFVIDWRTRSMADPFDLEMAPLKALWDQGRYGASFDALEVCTRHNRPLPAWLAEAADAALRFTYLNGGANGRGKHGGYRARDNRYLVDWERWAMASSLLDLRHILPELGLPATREGVFEHVSNRLAGSKAQGSPSAVKASYERMQRAKRGLG